MSLANGKLGGVSKSQPRAKVNLRLPRSCPNFHRHIYVNRVELQHGQSEAEQSLCGLGCGTIHSISFVVTRSDMESLKCAVFLTGYKWCHGAVGDRPNANTENGVGGLRARRVIML